MGDARQALADYPERPAPWGLLLMATGFACIVAGVLSTLPVLVAGGVAFLVGMVWQSASHRRWEAGFMRSMVASNDELISELREEYPETAVDAELGRN